MKELSIGQMARLNGLSEQTLRLYDKAGLFSPMYRDAENGYRYYDIRQSAQLDMIQHMKALGMSLKDIREQMTHFELDMFKTILHRNLEELELRSRELMYQRRAIERTLESYEWYENAPPDGTIVLEYIPRRLTYMTDSGVNFYDYDIDVYEKILRDLKENLIANQLSPHLFLQCRHRDAQGTPDGGEVLFHGDICAGGPGLCKGQPDYGDTGQHIPVHLLQWI